MDRMSMPAPLNARGAGKLAHQVYQETAWEAECRKMGDYPKVEAQLPMLSTRRRASLVDRLSSLLGSKNPLIKPVDAMEHTVWLFNNTAWRSAKGGEQQWSVEVVVAYFIKDSGDDKSKDVAKIIEILGIAPDESTQKRIAKRLEPFLDSVLPAHSVKLQMGDQTFKLSPSSGEGISSDVITFSGEQSLESIVPCLENIKSETAPVTHFAEETGWAIISDVDDTIKKTMTSTATGVLQSTLVDDPEPIAGMPELYNHIHETLGQPPFWYLSASPYNLYKFLRTFIFDDIKYPKGMLILRDASWQSLAGLLTSVTQGTQAYKVDRMRKIHRWFPKRKFVCIGDSSQSDPESYGQIFRENPGWVAAIFIRKVTGVSGVDMNAEAKNKPERFEKAFKDVPADVWTVFEDPKELFEKVNALTQAS